VTIPNFFEVKLEGIAGGAKTEAAPGPAPHMHAPQKSFSLPLLLSVASW
jgi:hypothetical protein